MKMKLGSGCSSLTAGPVLSPKRHLVVLGCVRLHTGAVHLDLCVTLSPSAKQLLVMLLLRPQKDVKLTPSLYKAEMLRNNEGPGLMCLTP